MSRRWFVATSISAFSHYDKLAKVGLHSLPGVSDIDTYLLCHPGRCQIGCWTTLPVIKWCLDYKITR